MEIEIWKPIKTLSGYEISSLGKIRSVDRPIINSRSLKPFTKKGKVLKTYINRGYECLFAKGKSYKIHRLVAEAFIDNPDNLPCVNHKNGIRDDNKLRNLEWVSYSENNIHSFRVLNRSKNTLGKRGALHPSAKKVRCSTLDLLFGSVTDAANMLDCDKSTIIKVCNGKEIATKGFYFQWV